MNEERRVLRNRSQLVLGHVAHHGSSLRHQLVRSVARRKRWHAPRESPTWTVFACGGDTVECATVMVDRNTGTKRTKLVMSNNTNPWFLRLFFSIPCSSLRLCRYPFSHPCPSCVVHRRPALSSLRSWGRRPWASFLGARLRRTHSMPPLHPFRSPFSNRRWIPTLLAILHQVARRACNTLTPRNARNGSHSYQTSPGDPCTSHAENHVHLAERSTRQRVPARSTRESSWRTNEVGVGTQTHRDVWFLKKNTSNVENRKRKTPAK